jgi:hypothetical protein
VSAATGCSGARRRERSARGGRGVEHPALGPGADEVCANAVAIVRAYLAGGQRSATQLNGYVRSVRLAVTRRSASAAGQDGARSTLSYVRGRWYIDQQAGLSTVRVALAGSPWSSSSSSVETQHDRSEHLDLFGK